jgi:ABC-type multidrug transport system fused ATPase/permease subunit
LLDDPLSAVDAHVGRHIINYILEFMRTTGSTVVIACHQLHFLHHGDLIVLIRDANICECGTHDELMQAGGEFRQLMDTHAATSDGESTPGSTPRATTDSHEATSPAVSNAQVLDALVGSGKEGTQMSAEDRTKGRVAKATYRFYARQFSCKQLAPLVALFLTAQSARFLMDLWMSRWAIGDTSVLPGGEQDRPSGAYATLLFAAGYACLGISSFLLNGIRFLWLQLIAVTASRNMHDEMLSNLLHAPASFFDTTPLGRIVNRFSGDINSLDFTLPVYYHQALMLFLQLLNSLAVVAAMLPPFILWVVPMAYWNNWLTAQYRNCARELKRLGSNLRSPMFQHFNESINGLITVRAFDAVPTFEEKSKQTVDDYARAQMAQSCAPRWLGMRISALAAVSIGLTAGGVIISRNQMDAGIVGIVLTYTELVNSTLQAFLQTMTEVRNGSIYTCII